MSADFSGPVAEIGRSMRQGILAALEAANRQAGAAGRRIELLALDDGYDPLRTARNMRRLVGPEEVLALVGNVGSPTAVVAAPIAVDARTLFLGAYSGAGVLRPASPERYVANYRASYAEEAAALVRVLVEQAGIDPSEIAFFTQRDSYGDAGFRGGAQALADHGLAEENEILHVRYERGSLAVEKAVASVMLAQPRPRAIIMVGTFEPSAKFLRLAREHGIDAFIASLSPFVGPDIKAQLGAAGEGLVVTQVVPPIEGAEPVVAEYLRDLALLEPQAAPSYTGLEGYIVARILLAALPAAGAPPSRERLVDALYGLGRFDLGLGVPLTLSPAEHQASHAVWVTAVRSGKLVPVDWGDVARMARNMVRP